jgi:hypothetical protein
MAFDVVLDARRGQGGRAPERQGRSPGVVWGVEAALDGEVNARSGTRSRATSHHLHSIEY